MSAVVVPSILDGIAYRSGHGLLQSQRTRQLPESESWWSWAENRNWNRHEGLRDFQSRGRRTRIQRLPVSVKEDENSKTSSVTEAGRESLI